MCYAIGFRSLNLVPPPTQAFTWGRFGLLGPLHRLVRLTSLKFERGSLDFSDIAALAPSLGLLTDLKRLELPDLDAMEFGTWAAMPDDVSGLTASLAGLVSLEHLVLGGFMGLLEEDMERILSSLTALQHLNLSLNGLTSDIAPALAALKAITHLDLSHNTLWGEAGMASVSASLSLLTGLAYLNLGNNHDGQALGDAAAAAALGLSLPPSLTYLSMADSYIGAACVLAYAPGLQRLTALRSLDLSRNIVVDSVEARTGCMQALGGCLERMPGLTALDLSRNHLGPYCMVMLTGSFQRLPNLQNLNLGVNLLGGGGAKVLAACLPHMPKLQELLLDGNSFGDDGFAAIAGSLMGLPSLAKIGFSRNELTGSAVKALAAALRATGRSEAMPALEYFEMGSNDFRNSSEDLADCLQHMPNLNSLRLNSVKIRDNNVATLLIALQKLDSLTYLDFELNFLTSTASSMLRAGLVRPGREIHMYQVDDYNKTFSSEGPLL